METLLSNYINGNLREARLQAKWFSLKAIAKALQELHGYSVEKAWLTASYLKTGEGFQEACDAQ